VSGLRDIVLAPETTGCWVHVGQRSVVFRYAGALG